MYWLVLIPVVLAVIAITCFAMRHSQSAGDSGPTDSIRDPPSSASEPTTDGPPASDRLAVAITELLDSAAPGERGGFVIFHGSREIDYVQFALEPNGLLLNWPTGQDEGAARLPVLENELNRRSFEKHPLDDDFAEQIGLLQQGEYVIADDGLYAQAGRSVVALRTLTDELLRDVFHVADPTSVQITLEPDG